MNDRMAGRMGWLARWRWVRERRRAARAWEPPRCRHGAILLGCPDMDCPEQRSHLLEIERAHHEYELRGRAIAEGLVASGPHWGDPRWWDAPVHDPDDGGICG